MPMVMTACLAIRIVLTAIWEMLRGLNSIPLDKEPAGVKDSVRPSRLA